MVCEREVVKSPTLHVDWEGGGQGGGGQQRSEMFTMTAAMGTLAATDFHSNDAGGMATAVIDTAAGVGGEGVFLA